MKSKRIGCDAPHPSAALAKATLPFSGEKEKPSSSGASSAAASSAAAASSVSVSSALAEASPPPPSSSAAAAMKASASDRNFSDANVLITRFTWRATREGLTQSAHAERVCVCVCVSWRVQSASGRRASAMTRLRRSYASSGVSRSSDISLCAECVRA
jgi:hypothetical protein